MLKRRLIAALLSLLSPGLGQVYNGQIRKGILLFLLIPCFQGLSIFLGLINSYRGFLAHMAVAFCLFVIIFADAVRTAGRQPSTTLPRRPWRAYAVAVCMLLLTATSYAAIIFFPNRIPLRYHAYRITNDAMAPTILKGDGIVANMWYYNTHAPTRGDVVVIAAPPFGSLAVKRVVALAGDRIERNPQSISPNTPVPDPYLGPVSGDEKALDKPSSLPADEVRVPAGDVFVMGDNRDHSYDSRYYGFLSLNRIKGKVLYIYRSADPFHVGKAIR